MEPEEFRMAWLPSKQYARMVDGERERIETEQVDWGLRKMLFRDE